MKTISFDTHCCAVIRSWWVTTAAVVEVVFVVMVVSAVALVVWSGTFVVVPWELPVSEDSLSPPVVTSVPVVVVELSVRLLAGSEPSGVLSPQPTAISEKANTAAKRRLK